MTIKRSDDEMRQADPLFDRLKQRPWRESREPSEQQIAAIQQHAAPEEADSSRRKLRPWLVWSAAAAVFIVLLAACAYAYDTPGGFADWRYSRAAGITGTVKIPIGKTPEEAVMKFRGYTSMRVVHQEAIDGGMLLFIKRDFVKGDGTDLGVEFVRRTWLGWKWVMGGMYGVGHPMNKKEAFNYMSMPRFEGIRGPFPIVFGQLMNSSITSIIVTAGGTNPGTYEAKVVEIEDGQRIWFAELPKTSDAPYGIEAHSAAGAIVASTTFNDPRNMASVPMSVDLGTELSPFTTEMIVKAIEDQHVKLVPYGITGNPMQLEQVIPEVYAIEAEDQTDQSDPEFVYFYIFPTVEARVKGAQQYNHVMIEMQVTNIPITYEIGNALVIYAAKSKEHPSYQQAIENGINRL
ncbi:hypothetical protein A8990_13365 [Paenibacillus taihuensis]|uniref:Uncharacterized protein n=1 Tax=Paenibacillus taihuensis TaxID=1156355 RepID=A0A3D9R2V7_9BACL|nr:hypothetical protein [Paenibacillus taihuensis]REE69600.1 hypothetical protein A8990_13365 [Paenibacillus taihuensis]